MSKITNVFWGIGIKKDGKYAVFEIKQGQHTGGDTALCGCVQP